MMNGRKGKRERGGVGRGKGGGRGSNQIPKARPNSRLHTRAIPKTKYFIKTGKSFDF